MFLQEIISGIFISEGIRFFLTFFNSFELIPDCISSNFLFSIQLVKIRELPDFVEAFKRIIGRICSGVRLEDNEVLSAQKFLSGSIVLNTDCSSMRLEDNGEGGEQELLDSITLTFDYSPGANSASLKF